jgi:hypoxanthine phosphoribosyltransferase
VRGRRPRRKANGGRGTSISAARIGVRVAALGREISRAYENRRLDVIVTLERGFVFGADLIREIALPVVCHFLQADVRDVQQAGRERREIVFGITPNLKGRDVLLVDAVLESGVTQEFLLKRLGESHPRSLRLAVLLDKANRRKVELEPDYFGFRTASNGLWVGYGLSAPNGVGSNQRNLVMRSAAPKRHSRAAKVK